MKDKAEDYDFDKTRSLVEKGEFSKLPALTIEFFSQKDPNNKNLVSLAICCGQMDKLPEHLLTEELLLDKDNDGNTALHHACSQYDLNFIPEKFLKKEYLKIGNHMGESVYHIAADYGQLNQIPISEFDEEVLLMADRSGHKVLNRVLCPEIRRDLPDFDQSAIVLKYLKTKTIRENLERAQIRGPRNNDDNLDYEVLSAELNKRVIKKAVKETPNEEIEL